MVARSSLIFSSIALLTSFVNAYGQVAQVVDANNFCVFLPPADSVDRGIADTEWNAEAFCIGKTPLAKNAGKLNSGFIQSAHFVKTDAYVQVTGQIDPKKANLIPSDEGGQYDIKAPRGSSCAGWKYYVNLVEPAGNTYCMRCCNDDRTCNRGISEKGCAHIIPGDYSGPLGDKGSSEPPAATSSKPKTTKAKTTTSVTKTKTKESSASKTTTAKVADSAPSSVPPPVDPIAPAAGAAAGAGAAVGADAAVAGAADAGAANPVANAPTITPASPPVASSSSSSALSSASSNVEVLSQQKVTEQSVNGANGFNPGMATLAISAISMALMMYQ